MSLILPNGTVDLHGLRQRLYDLLGLCFSAVSPAPGCLPLLQVCGAVRSPNGLFRCRGRVRGQGFAGKRFSVQEVRANAEPVAGAAFNGFDGLIVSFAHDLRIYGRTVVLPDLGVLNPRHVDGMKRVGVPSRAFEAEFEIYADDQTEGRALIPPDFMERLMAFDTLLPGGHARVAFSGRQMHVALPMLETVRISSDLSFDHLETAARHVAGEMAQVFDIVAEVDILHSKADRHCTAERNRAREDHYATACAAIEPSILAALDSGEIANDPRAKHLTDTAWTTDPALRGLLMPRV